MKSITYSKGEQYEHSEKSRMPGYFISKSERWSCKVIYHSKSCGIDGLQQLIQTIGMAKRRLNPNLSIEGILFTIVEANTNLSKNAMEAIRDAYGEHVRIFDCIIPKSTKAAECPGSGLSIFRYDPKGKVAAAYEMLTKEVIN